MSSSRSKKAAVPVSRKRKGASSSSSPTAEDDPGKVQFGLGGLVRQVGVPEFIPGGATYNPSLSKASALPPSLKYLHAILAHTITRRRESTGVVNTHDAYFLWCMSYGAEEPTLLNIVSPNLPRRRPTRTFLMMSLHSTRIPRLSHHHPLVQFMRRLHMLTSLSAALDSSSSVFNNLKTLILLYSRFVSTSTSHRQSNLANHPVMKIYIELLSSSSHRNKKLHRERFSTTTIS
ncbi:hypothetical protein GOBAR_AA32615 [Gossypium barbadense]|uniref:Uncharacterized protein n=1 Tax=Gossypium barbadense TaxID=3634 RepID=A0A2P5WAG6_GOSBA|nr:hypothetical protein GOBAR_AA32615 [Gossypium barbadense]